MSRRRCAGSLVALLCGVVLVARPRIAAAQAGAAYPLSAIGSQCIEFAEIKFGSGPIDYRECRVSESGEFGAVDNQVFYYAIYCLLPDHAAASETCEGESFTAQYYRSRALAVFTRDRSDRTARLMLERADLLQIPIALDGPGAGNDCLPDSRCGRVSGPTSRA